MNGRESEMARQGENESKSNIWLVQTIRRTQPDD